MRRPVYTLLLGLGVAILAGLAQAGEPAPLDWSQWRELPVLHRGRIQPLDTFARRMVDAVCDRERPTLAPPPKESVDASTWDEIKGLFPDGKPRTFEPHELLFSWIIESERWDRVPFLSAGNEDLRKLLGLPNRDAEGNHLKYASPHDVAEAEAFWKRLNDLDVEAAKARRLGQTPAESDATDKKAGELREAFMLYRMLATNPMSGGSNRFQDQLGGAAELWSMVQQHATRLRVLGDDSEAVKQIAPVGEAVSQLTKALQGEDKSGPNLREAEPALATMREKAAALAAALDARHAELTAMPAQQAPARREEILTTLRTMASQTRDMARMLHEAHVGMYDTGRALAIVPALNAAALDARRNAEDGAQPWLSLQAVVLGSETLLRDYPKRELNEVRESFREVATAYVERNKPDRPERFAAGMKRFSSAVRALGEALEPIREKLPVATRDGELLAATAYPPMGATRVELFYNDLRPFVWTWVLNLAAVGCLLLTPVARRTFFWSGIVLLVGGLAFNFAGLAIRTYVTGRAPVTNMFETIVFVAFIVSLLGLWFTLLPFLWRGLSIGWRLTAIPHTWEATSWHELGIRQESHDTFDAAALGMLLPRFLLAVGIVWGFYTTGYLQLGRWTAINASAPNVSDIIVWLTSVGVCAASAWFLPRTALALGMGVWWVPYCLYQDGLRKPMEQSVTRTPFAISGAAVAFLAALIATFTSAFDENISPLMPVLRNNFWLTTHVLTITASYGAGALAWALGNITLGYYLFGKYRDPVASAPQQGTAAPGEASVLYIHRPPEICNLLATYIYKATQVAVILLAAGTILGALWADVSWGRFWGWDSKEVWALISLLAYLAVLHGRYAGIFGNFGLAVGSVAGATAILLAWYGVNFVFGTGLHAYGGGVGGVGYVLSALILNWVFVGCSAARYLAEMKAAAGSHSASTFG
jgi:ABC-type transport system involved in cytochrome c biogenesis permease subunit